MKGSERRWCELPRSRTKRADTLWGMADVGTSSLRERLFARREEIQAVVARHRGRRVRLFGSVARGDDTSNSDIDLLVDFEPGSSLFDLHRLTGELETILGQRVDVISSGGLKPRDGHLLADAVDL
jgi:uncharacterized protein